MCTTLPHPVIHLYEQNETEVLHLSLDHMRIDIMDWTSLFCYSNHMMMISERRRYGRIFFRSMKSFGYSYTQNKSMVIWCCAYAYIGNYKYENLSNNYTSGCVSVCNGQDSSRPKSCSGIGCCQGTFPKDLSTLEIHAAKRVSCLTGEDPLSTRTSMISKKLTPPSPIQTRYTVT